MLLYLFRTELLLYAAYFSAYAIPTNEKIWTEFGSHFFAVRATPVSIAVEHFSFSNSSHVGVLEIPNEMPVVDMLTVF